MGSKYIFIIFLSLIIISMVGTVSAGGGATVRISTIDLSEQGNDYSMKPGRLKFEFDENLYAIQVRRVKQEYVWFLVMDLDENKQDDITAYTVEDSFNLTIGKKKEIDLDKDKVNDIFIELNEIISNTGSVRSVDFSIKKINNERLDESNEAVSESVESETQKSILEPVLVLNQEAEEQLTFFGNMISWFRGLF